MQRFLPTFIILSSSLVCMVCISLYCGPAEYEVHQECCPMCSPGYHVFKHCTEHISTTCAQCSPSTYTDAPNGLMSCMSCTACDSNAGLRERKACSSTSDALCEPLEGYYCTDPVKDGCRGAVEHTKCSPGQYIKRNGTASSDIVCDYCGNNTYSDGSFTSCKPHIQCQLGYEKVKDGTPSSDTECQKIWKDLIVGVTVPVIILVLTAVALMVRLKKTLTEKLKRKERRGGSQSGASAGDNT